jgi:hypothetical protein
LTANFCYPIIRYIGAQIFALAINLFIVVAFLACQARNGMGWLSWLEKLPEVYSLHLDNLSQSVLLNPGWSLKVLISAVATLALLGGVVIYLASEKQYSTTGIPSSHLRVPVCRRFTLL